MEKVEFLRPRLTGPRFEGHAIPLEFLQDFSVFEEMIVEVAKWKYLYDHPERSRSPRGFIDGIQLELANVAEGSAIPVIMLSVAASTTLFPPQSQEYFEEARDSIIAAIEAVDQNRSITEHIPEKALIFFDRFGRSLRDGEAIEFPKGLNGHSVRLTKETRRKLVFSSPNVTELTEEISVRGAIPKVDLDAMTFHIQVLGKKIQGPIAPQHIDVIMQAVNGYTTGRRVLLKGVGRFDRHERIKSLDSVEHVSILHPLDIPSRLDELRQMKDGWMDGRGIAPKGKGLDEFGRLFESSFPEELPLPYLYPTAEGGLQAEWTFTSDEVTLEVDLTHQTGEWHALNLATQEEFSRQMGLHKPEDWHWITEQIRQASGEMHG